MADAKREEERNLSTNVIIGYVRAVVFLGLGAYMLTRIEFQYKIVGGLFVIYGIWRLYSTYKKSRVNVEEKQS